MHGPADGRPYRARRARDHQSARAVSHRHQAEDLWVYLPAIQSPQRHQRHRERHAPGVSPGRAVFHLKQQALGLLELFNLAHKAAAKVEWLSGGEAQRTAIARALVNHPEVIIADEPTAHLDTRLSREFMDIMRDFKAQGKPS